MTTSKRRYRSTLIAIAFMLSFSSNALAMYAPGLGRFCSRDPVGYDNDQHFYQFVQGRSLLATDPTGNDLVIVPGSEHSPGESGTIIGGGYPGILLPLPAPGTTIPPEFFPTYPEFDPPIGDWLDCMAGCLREKNSTAEIARKGATATIGFRKIKSMTISKVSTQFVWKSTFNSIGTQCGKVFGIGPKVGRWVVSRTVVVITIVEGVLSWGDMANCQGRCF